MAIPEKALHILAAANVPEITEPSPPHDSQYWFKTAVRYVLDGGDGGVKELMDRYERDTPPEGKLSSEVIAAVLQANRICMAARCWELAKRNHALNKRGSGMIVKELVDGMHEWLTGTGVTTANLGIPETELADVSSSKE